MSFRPQLHAVPCDRRPGTIPGRRFAFALAIALVVLLTAGTALADDSGSPLVTATVYAQGGQTSQDAVSVSQLTAAPQTCPAYTKDSMAEYNGGLRTDVPMANNNPPLTGTWPVSSALACMQNPIALGQVTSVTVLDGSGAPQTGANSQLLPGDLQSPSDFQDPSESPVVSTGGSSNHYDRPWRGGSDSNYLDHVDTDGPVQINVYEGPHLEVHIAPPVTIQAGQSAAFNATVSGNGSSSPQYHWSFGDNVADSTQASPTVTYPDAGTHTVTLLVTANGGGGSDTASITVSGASNPTPPQSPSGPSSTGGPAKNGSNPSGGTKGTTKGNGKGSGKTGSTGNGNHTKPSKGRSGGPSPSSSHHEKDSNSGSHGSSGGSGGANGDSNDSSSGGSDNGASGGSTSSPDTGQPSSPSSSSSPEFSPVPLSTPSTRRPARPHRAAHRPPSQTRSAPTTTGPGRVVSGELIADVTPLSAANSPLVHPAAGSAALAAPRHLDAVRSPLAIIAACLAIVALLVLGAGHELGGPGWWRRLPWRRVLRLGS